MHSFTHPHSFLVAILFCLVSLSSIFGGAAAAQASDISELNKSEPIKHVAPSLHDGHRRRHLAISDALDISHRAMRYPGRRAAGATFTHFDTGLGACGHVNVPSDFIVAISQLQWEGGKHCGEAITITANGKTAHATIMDECMGCEFNNIDLTNGLYGFFDPTFVGTFTGDWEFGSGGPAPPPPPKKSAPPPPVKTTTQVHHTTSSKSSAQPTSSKASTTNVATTTSQSISSSAVPSATTSATTIATTGNLGNLFGALINLGGLVVQTVPSSS